MARIKHETNLMNGNILSWTIEERPPGLPDVMYEIDGKPTPLPEVIKAIKENTALYNMRETHG